MIDLANNTTLTEATGQALHLSEGAVVTYESGLSDTEFVSGPGGVWKTTLSSWQEL